MLHIFTRKTSKFKLHIYQRTEGRRAQAPPHRPQWLFSSLRIKKLWSKMWKLQRSGWELAWRAARTSGWTAGGSVEHTSSLHSRDYRTVWTLVFTGIDGNRRCIVAFFQCFGITWAVLLNYSSALVHRNFDNSLRFRPVQRVDIDTKFKCSIGRDDNNVNQFRKNILQCQFLFVLAHEC